MFGLPDATLVQIIACIQRFPTIAWVRVYGSRAMGTYSRGSDIDLAFSSPEDCSAELLAALDALPTPYLFDVTHYESLRHEGLKAHIDRVGKQIYPTLDLGRQGAGENAGENAGEITEDFGSNFGTNFGRNRR